MQLPAPVRTPKISLSRYEALSELYQAENAVAIAQAASAERYAPEAWAAARHALGEAQRLQSSKASAKLVIENARDAAQRAEDARAIAERAGARTPVEGAAPEANREAPEPALRARLHERVDGSLLAQDTRQSLVITLPETAFDGGSLLRSIAEKLAPVASALVSQPGVHVEVKGYMDSAELASWERAVAVGNAMVASGVAANQVSMRGGNVLPGQQDRRVQIVISTDPLVTSGRFPFGTAGPPQPLAAEEADRRSSPGFGFDAPRVISLPSVRENPILLAAPRLPPQAVPVVRLPAEAARHHVRGRKLLNQERFAEAIEELTETLQLDDSLALAYNARGFAHLRLREYSDAVADFDSAIRLNPSYANAYVNRGVGRRALGDRTGASSDMAKARELGGAL